MEPRSHTLFGRLSCNAVYFAAEACGQNLVALGFGSLLFGFTNVVFFLCSAGITASVGWEIRRSKERKQTQAFMLERFGALPASIR